MSYAVMLGNILNCTLPGWQSSAFPIIKKLALYHILGIESKRVVFRSAERRDLSFRSGIKEELTTRLGDHADVVLGWE